MTIQKTVQATIDLDIERKRINKAFTSKKERTIKKKLHELVDLIEKEEWYDAYLMLNDDWWMDRDPKRECPRGEFIGMIPYVNPSVHFNHSATLADLVCSFIEYPKVYKVIETEKEK
jgi:hypothetical protein